MIDQIFLVAVCYCSRQNHKVCQCPVVALLECSLYQCNVVVLLILNIEGHHRLRQALPGTDEISTCSVALWCAAHSDAAARDLYKILCSGLFRGKCFSNKLRNLRPAMVSTVTVNSRLNQRKLCFLLRPTLYFFLSKPVAENWRDYFLI